MRDVHIFRYTIAARITFSTALVSLAVPLLNPFLQLTELHHLLFGCMAGLFAVISLALVWHIRNFRRRTEKFFKKFSDDALEGDFQDIVGRWELIADPEDKEGRCVPNGPNGFWVAEEEGKVIGCVGLSEFARCFPTLCFSRPKLMVVSFSERHPRDYEVGDVGRLFVSPEHQRKGIGEKLMAVVDGHARANGIRKLELLTSYLNKPALRMYTKRGWEQRGEIVYGGQRIPVLGRDLDKES